MPPRYVPPSVPGFEDAGAGELSGATWDRTAAGKTAAPQGAAAAGDTGVAAPKVDPWTGKPVGTTVGARRRQTQRKTLNDLEIPKKKNDFFVVLVVGLMFAVVCGVVVCFGLPMLGVSILDQAVTGVGGDLPIPIDGGYRVTYRLEGQAGEVAVGYFNERGRMVTQNVGLPWETTVVMQVGNMAMVNAQTKNRNTSLTCIILVNDIEYRRSSDSGDFARVMCTGPLTP